MESASFVECIGGIFLTVALVTVMCWHGPYNPHRIPLVHVPGPKRPRQWGLRIVQIIVFIALALKFIDIFPAGSYAGLMLAAMATYVLTDLWERLRRRVSRGRQEKLPDMLRPGR
jgi:hypothetical protein